MNHLRLLPLVVLAVVGAPAVIGSAAGQVGVPGSGENSQSGLAGLLAQMGGEWRCAPQALQVAENSIRAATTSLAFFQRVWLRGKLISQLAPRGWGRIETQGRIAILEFAGRQPEELPLSGQTVAVCHWDVSLHREGRAVLHSKTSAEARREDRFTVSPDGQHLTVETIYKGEGLPQPIRFSVQWIRVPA